MRAVEGMGAVAVAGYGRVDPPTSEARPSAGLGVERLHAPPSFILSTNRWSNPQADLLRPLPITPEHTRIHRLPSTDPDPPPRLLAGLSQSIHTSFHICGKSFSDRWTIQADHPAGSARLLWKAWKNQAQPAEKTPGSCRPQAWSRNAWSADEGTTWFRWQGLRQFRSMTGDRRLIIKDKRKILAS